MATRSQPVADSRAGTPDKKEPLKSVRSPYWKWPLYLWFVALLARQVAAGPVFRIGYEHSPPAQFVDPEGRVSGPIFEAVNLAAIRGKVRLEWVHAPEGPDRALTAGRVDLWPLLADIPERRGRIRITDPYMRVRFWLISREENGIRNLKDAVGRRVLHLRGKVYESLVRKYLAEALPEVSPDFQSAMAGVCRGYADMALVAQGTGDHIFLKEGGCDVGKIRVLALPGGLLDFGLGAKWGSGEAERAAQALQKQLMRLFDEGALSAIWIRWGLMGTETRMLSDYLSSQRESRFLLGLSGLLVVALAVAGWQTVLNIRKSRQLGAALAELKKAQAMLVHSEKMAGLGQMTAGVAHEINNPLAYVSANHETLHRDFNDLLFLLAQFDEATTRLSLSDPEFSERLRRKAQEIDLAYLAEAIPRKIQSNQDGLERMRQLVVDLRTFSRLDEAVWKRCELEEGIRSVLRFLQPLMLSHDVQVVTRFAPRAVLWCSPSALNQAVSNIVANAIQASAPASVVRLNTAMGNGGVLIEVEDSGCGIPKEAMERVLEPFFTTKPPGSGTGLGLSIAHQIIQQHKGRLEISSEPGRGTRVTIWVPTGTA